MFSSFRSSWMLQYLSSSLSMVMYFSMAFSYQPAFQFLRAELLRMTMSSSKYSDQNWLNMCKALCSCFLHYSNQSILAYLSAKEVDTKASFSIRFRLFQFFSVILAAILLSSSIAFRSSSIKAALFIYLASSSFGCTQTKGFSSEVLTGFAKSEFFLRTMPLQPDFDGSLSIDEASLIFQPFSRILASMAFFSALSV